MTRILVSLAMSTLFLSVASVASAGGWAVTTLDSLSGTFVAGQTYRIGFVMRQHGVTPFSGATPAIVVTRGATQLEFAARAEGVPGHYVADVTFPSDGDWAWSVDQSPFPMRQALGTLSVAAPDGVSVRPRPPAELAFVGLLALGALGAGLALATGATRLTGPMAGAQRQAHSAD
jgi:hypothetical protein